MKLIPTLRLRADLGIRALVPEWRAMLSRRDLAADVIAGLTVACIAVPLSLAIALASGVAPAAGIVTAIVAGIACSLLGGTRLAVSGPAAAMAVLVATVVERHGLSGLLVVGMGCGFLQLATGVFGLGRMIRLVPVSVVEGFTAGIGAIILIGQLPRALGLPAPPESHVLDVITHIGELLHQSRVAAIAVAGGCLALILALNRISKRIPAHLIAVAVPTVVVALLGLDLETIGEIPRALPAPSLPSVPAGPALASLIGPTLLVFALASLETLLSMSAVDKLAGTRSDPDQELIGQGVGNVLVALFGGIPVTGVIARSGANVQVGAKTRRAAIVHAVAIFGTVLVFAPAMSRIPVAALAGVLIAVALRMLSPSKLIGMYRTSRGDAITFVATFVVIVLVGLIEGVQWGIVAALAIAAVKMARMRAVVHGAHDDDGPCRLALSGPITFLSSLEIDRVREQLEELDASRSVVLDMHEVSQTDASGTEMVVGLVERLRGRGINAVIVGLREECRTAMLSGAPELGECLASTEEDAARLLAGRASLTTDARLALGVERFQRDVRPRYVELFRHLASGQNPHTLFITCADSRFSPNLLTSTDPGELFVVRNVGNMIEPFSRDHAATGGADVEYAVGVLGVRMIVVCAHSSCGAIRALRSESGLPGELETLRCWLHATNAREVCARLPAGVHADDVAKMNALEQLDHLKTYPVVRERLEAGELVLRAWYFDIQSGSVELWSDESKTFAPIARPRDALEATRPRSPGARAS